MISSTYDRLSAPARLYLTSSLGIRKTARNIEFNNLKPVSAMVEEAHLDQVDIALMLLRANYLSDVELLVGHAVTVCPPGEARGLRAETLQDRADWLDDWLRRHPDPWEIDNWRVVHRAPDPPPNANSEQAAAHRLVRIGYTVRQLIVRGFTYEDIEVSQRHSWMRLAPQQVPA
jgi:hypothetical protein